MVTMSLEREVRLLSLVDVLEPLSEEELEEVATRCRDISLDGDEEFFGSEEYDGGLFLLEEGHLVVYKLTSSGTQLTIALHSAGAVLPALRLRGLYVKALEPSVVAFMSRGSPRGLPPEKPTDGGTPPRSPGGATVLDGHQAI